MLPRTRILICVLLGFVSVFSGCVPDYKTEIAQQCSDGKTDGDETDVDCGGSCNACAVEKACKLDADCATSTCIALRCFDPTCRNGKQDEASGETDVDCGGPMCPACRATQHCSQNSDCANGDPCLSGTCYSTVCNNGKRDNDESDVDCGGSQCPACAAQKDCKQTSDCRADHLCLDKQTFAVISNGEDYECGDAGPCAMAGACYKASCKNGNLDGTETDNDCGGELCPACAVGRACIQNSDCSADSLCLNKICYPAACGNGKPDGFETDKDCGGSQCPVCTKGKACKVASDCEAKTPCTNGKCGDPLCFNVKQDVAIGETDEDCGGSTCGPCGLNKTCLQHSDCESLNCAAGKCAPPSCTDKSKNQGESAPDCGDPTNLCSRCAIGATCTDNANCESKHCLGGFCVAATCDDKILNGNEPAIDCGGSCPRKCPDDSPCTLPSECTSGVCRAQICRAPTCSDGVTNGQETGQDCGGGCLQVSPTLTCATGQPCTSNIDCTFNNCVAGTCQDPACGNNTLDVGNETDVDCGGKCGPCGDNLKCLTDPDCKSKVCDSGTKTCTPASCYDRAQNGNETDVNCGGVTCTARCNTGQRCQANSDCQGKVCDLEASKCLTPTCSDLQVNGSETGPDCGGSCALMSPAKTCGTGVPCTVDDDCTSKNCCTAASCQGSINTCVAAGCQDGKRNQGESGIDCGGDAATTGCQVRCPPGQGCQLPTDCDSGVCGTDKLCVAPKCDDGVKNGTEMGKDCGSAACSKPCPEGTPCTGPADCDSGVCGTDKLCAPPKCDDTIQNGTETAPDCGGNCTVKCGLGQGCAIKADCDPAIPSIDCITLKCTVPSCQDNAVDGDESDLNCGGSCPDKCADKMKCRSAADCTSNLCAADSYGVLRCAVPTCGDRTQNQGESGIDCGGSSPCDRCGPGYGCTQKSDCINGVCGSNNVCAEPTCSDTVQNQSESDLDCGGPYCRSSSTACDNGKKCVENADCKDFWCTIPAGATTSVCVQPSCSDGQQNGSESDKDCGGTCPTKCPDTYKCTKDSDCANGWCNNLKCAMPACTDTVKNGTETGPDCGGNCAAGCTTAYDGNCKQCSDNASCNGEIDCKSLNCVNNLCTYPSGSSTRECVGKVLDGTSCKQCDTTVNVNPAYCRAYLWCMYQNNCNPGTVAAQADCVSGSKNGVCSVNKLNKTQEALYAAINAYRCACP